MIVTPIRIECRHRNHRDSGRPGQPLGKLPVGQIGNAIIARQLEVGSITRQKFKTRVRELIPEEIALLPTSKVDIENSKILGELRSENRA